MNYIELNYVSEGPLSQSEIESSSKSLWQLYNGYFQDLKENERFNDRMDNVISFDYNWNNEIDRKVCSELLAYMVNQINEGVVNYPTLTRNKVAEFDSVAGKYNSDFLLHYVERRIETDPTNKKEIKELVIGISKLISSTPQLSHLKLEINPQVIDSSFIKAGAFLKQIKDNKSGGCYIATMAYGDYDHPQVMKLRSFRDDILSTSLIGRGFIRFYYFISPKLVILLKDFKTVNKLIRKSLDVFIKTIKR